MKSTTSSIENVLEQVVKSISSKSAKNNKRIFKRIMDSHKSPSPQLASEGSTSSAATVAESVLSTTNMRLKRPISGYHLFLRKNIQESSKSARQASFLFDHAAQRWRALSVSEKIVFMRQADYLNKVNGFNTTANTLHKALSNKSLSGSHGKVPIGESVAGINWNANVGDLDREAEQVTQELKSFIDGKSEIFHDMDLSSSSSSDKHASSLSTESLLLGSDRKLSGYNIFFKDNYKRIYNQHRTQLASIRAIGSEWQALPVNEKARYNDTACRINSIKEWLATNTCPESSDSRILQKDPVSQRSRNWNMSGLKDTGKTAVGYDSFMRLFYPALRERYPLLSHRGTLDRMAIIWRLMSTKQRKILMNMEPRLFASFDFVYPTSEKGSAVVSRRSTIIQPIIYNAFYSFVLSKYVTVRKDKPHWSHQEIMKSMASVWNTSLSPVDRQLFIDDCITKSAIKNLIIEANPLFDTGFGIVKYVAVGNKLTEDVFEFTKEEEYKCMKEMNAGDSEKRYRHISEGFHKLIQNAETPDDKPDLDNAIENLLKVRPTENSFQLYIKELSQQQGQGTDVDGNPLPEDVFLRNADVAEKWKHMEAAEKEIYLKKFQDMRSSFKMVAGDFLAELMSSLFLVVVDKVDADSASMPSQHFVKQLEEFWDKYGTSSSEVENNRTMAKSKFMNEHVATEKFEQNLRKIWQRKPYDERRHLYDKYGVKMAVYEYIRQTQTKIRSALESDSLSDIEHTQEYTDLERQWQHLTHVQKTFYSKWDFQKLRPSQELTGQGVTNLLPKEYTILRSTIPDIALKAELRPPSLDCKSESTGKIVKLGVSAYSSVYRQFFHHKLAEEQHKYHKVVKFLAKNASSTSAPNDRSMTKLKDQEMFSDALKRYAGGWRIAAVCEHIHQQWIDINTDVDKKGKIQSIE